MSILSPPLNCLLSIITQLVTGNALPGRPIAVISFKPWGYVTITQPFQFTSDLEEPGHYMKIPRHLTFWCQIVATVIAGTMQLGVQAWIIEDLCSADQPDSFVCSELGYCVNLCLPRPDACLELYFLHYDGKSNSRAVAQRER